MTAREFVTNACVRALRYTFSLREDYLLPRCAMGSAVCGSWYYMRGMDPRAKRHTRGWELASEALFAGGIGAGLFAIPAVTLPYAALLLYSKKAVADMDRAIESEDDL